MDIASVISTGGLEVMANPEVHINDTQLAILTKEKQKSMDHKRLKALRKQRYLARRQETIEQVNSVLSIDNNSSIAYSVSPTVSPLESPAIASHINQLPSVLQQQQQQQQQQRQEKEEDNPDLSPTQIQKLVELSVMRALKKHGPPSLDQFPTINNDYNNYMEDDVEYRLKNMHQQGVEYSRNFDLETADKRRKEMEHWRMKLTLEERELEQNCSTFIAVGADLLEGLCDAIDFHTFETKHLSVQMDDAIRDGRFNSCIKQYANMGGGQFMKNPLLNFLSTFSSVALKNHLSQKKNKILTGGNKSQRTTLRSSKRIQEVPSYYNNSTPNPQYQPSYPPPQSTSSHQVPRHNNNNNNNYNYNNRPHNYNYNNRPHNDNNNSHQPHNDNNNSHQPHNDNNNHQHHNDNNNNHQHHNDNNNNHQPHNDNNNNHQPHNDNNNNHQPHNDNTYNHRSHNTNYNHRSHNHQSHNHQQAPPPHNNNNNNQAPPPHNNNPSRNSHHRATPPHNHRCPSIAPSNTTTTTTASTATSSHKTSSVPLLPTKQTPVQKVASRQHKKPIIVQDTKTGKSRILMNEISESLPMDKITNTMSKFNPMLKHVKMNMEQQKDIEDERKKLDKYAPEPQELH